MAQLLSILESINVLRPLDAALGRLLETKSLREGEIIGLAGAAASYALSHAHSCLPLAHLTDLLREAAAADITLPPLPSVDVLRAALETSPLVARGAEPILPLVFDKQDRLYLRRYWGHEQTLATQICAKLRVSAPLPDVQSIRNALARFSLLDGTMPNWQAIAVLTALRSRFAVITGGPGTGKTTCVLWLLALLIEQALATGEPAPRIALAAPTGKAATRLADAIVTRKTTLAVDAVTRVAIPDQATTVHRLLGGRPGGQHFRHDRANRLPVDIVIVDEASMLDLPLAARLMDALPEHARLVLLGDPNQLASVEAGSVLPAITEAAGTANTFSSEFTVWVESVLGVSISPSTLSHSPPVSASRRGHVRVTNADEGSVYFNDAIVELRESRRFNVDSVMGQFANTVRTGDIAGANALLVTHAADLCWKNLTNIDWIASSWTEIMPHYMPLLSLDDPSAALKSAERYRVLTAVRQGPSGCVTFNTMIEAALRNHAKYRDNLWFHGRLVLITENDYRSGLFNGDVGIALATGTHGALEAWFRGEGDELRSFTPNLLPIHQSAFAMTVHKAQGSEFDEVLVVLPERDVRVLSRELLYTAVTRAKHKVTLWTNSDVLETSLNRSTKRWSGLADALTA